MRSTPTAITGVREAKALSVGSYAACVITGDSSNVQCWGYLGFTAVQAPTQIRGITEAVSISVGSGHLCAVLRAGTVKCWGTNTHGQAGPNAVAVLSFDAVTVPGISNATTISAAYEHTCAVLKTGRIRCWGNNGNGQLGNGVPDDTIPFSLSGLPVADPVEVAGITTAVAVSTDQDSTCALLRDGAVYCWGRAITRDGSVADKPSGLWTATPRRVALAKPAIAVAAKFNGGCAALVDGSIHCWADSGELIGLGERTSSNRLPQPLSGVTVGPGCNSQTCLDAEAVFQWAEDELPDALQPPRATSTSTPGLYWRRYGTSSAYLGVSTTGAAPKLLYLGPLSANQVIDLGELSVWRERVQPKGAAESTSNWQAAVP